MEKEKVIKNNGKNSVIIIAITQNKEYIITFQNRIKDKIIAEFPSGYIENGEDPISAAKRELKEETGYITSNLFIVDEAYTCPGIDNSVTYIVIANNCIKTHDDWTSNNGLSTSVEFTAQSGHSGTFTIADLVFTGDLSDEECEASFMPDTAIYEEPQDFVCMIVDDVYYGENGTVVTEEEYYEQCCNYTCTIIDDKYYFDSNGNSVTYEEMVEDCGETDIVVDPEEPIDNPQTGINYGYILLPIGIVSIIAIIKISKKNTKIYKI